ncbi:MAG: basic amino acid/polyamine antiporter, family [Gaiellaceae bacterium]|nr:basic amino acid/polyamine antiporter, family [Gaiellaceae bacterium]
MARKLPQLERELDARSIFSVAYGEIASSIYFALGIVVAHALGLAPLVLLATGGLFLLVAASYAEGATMVEETGGAATFVRRAFNDFAGFLTGWALFLDYLIVIALSALFLPYYLAYALDLPWLSRHATLVSCSAIVLIAVARVARRARLYRFAIALAVLDILTQALLVVLGLALLVHPHVLASSVQLGQSPTWSALAFALPVAMLAYTGLETVANLAEEAIEPGVSLPRSLMSAIGAVIAVTVLTAIIGLSAFPVHNGHSALGDKSGWLQAPILGIVFALGPHLPHWADQVLRVFVGVSGAAILMLAASTSISGCGRLAYSLGEHGQLPRVFGLLHRRTLVSPYAIVAAATIAIGLLLGTALFENPIAALASLYSFGVLFAFIAAQLAVLRLRVTDPDRPRPFRVPLPVRIRGHELPLPALVGVTLSIAVWIVALATHPAARYGGPVWMLAGFVIYLLVRRGRGAGLLEHVVSADEQVLPVLQATSILVPMKLGEIGEEMLATAIKLAQERNGFVIALNVVVVPLEYPLDLPLEEKEERAQAALEEARLLGEEHGVLVTGLTVRARNIGSAIVEEAVERSVDLIVMGSAPRWRRFSRFFSPTVEYVLRKAPCEVLIVAFPQGVLEDDLPTPTPAVLS